MGGPQAPLSCKHLELKLRVFIAGHIVAMVTYCAKKIDCNILSNDWADFDTMSLTSINIGWL